MKCIIIIVKVSPSNILGKFPTVTGEHNMPTTTYERGVLLRVYAELPILRGLTCPLHYDVGLASLRTNAAYRINQLAEWLKAPCYNTLKPSLPAYCK